MHTICALFARARARAPSTPSRKVSFAIRGELLRELTAVNPLRDLAVFMTRALPPDIRSSRSRTTVSILICASERPRDTSDVRVALN